MKVTIEWQEVHLDEPRAIQEKCNDCKLHDFCGIHKDYAEFALEFSDGFNDWGIVECTEFQKDLKGEEK